MSITEKVSSYSSISACSVDHERLSALLTMKIGQVSLLLKVGYLPEIKYMLLVLVRKEGATKFPKNVSILMSKFHH
jgi:hypothetical protein